MARKDEGLTDENAKKQDMYVCMSRMFTAHPWRQKDSWKGICRICLSYRYMMQFFFMQKGSWYQFFLKLHNHFLQHIKDYNHDNYIRGGLHSFL